MRFPAFSISYYNGSWWNIIQQPRHSLGRCKAYGHAYLVTTGWVRAGQSRTTSTVPIHATPQRRSRKLSDFPEIFHSVEFADFKLIYDVLNIFSVTRSWIEMKATCWLRKTFVNIMVLYTGICTGVRGCHGDYLVFAGITWGCRHGNLGCGRWMEGGRRDRLSTFQACL